MKDRIKGSVSKKQLMGAVILLMIAVMIYSMKSLARSFVSLHSSSVPHYTEEISGSTVVKIEGVGKNDGIYFLPGSWTLGDFIEMVESDIVDEIACLDSNRVLENGERVIVDSRNHGVHVQQIENHEKLALEIPIDINSATMDDLMLIPGIGKSTASAIVELRDKQGSFSSLDEVKSIRGLGEERIKIIKRYLVLDR